MFTHGSAAEVAVSVFTDGLQCRHTSSNSLNLTLWHWQIFDAYCHAWRWLFPSSEQKKKKTKDFRSREEEEAEGSWQRLKTAGNKNPSGFKNRTKTLFTFLHDEEEKNNFHYFVSSCFMSLWKDHSAFTSSQLLLPPSYNCDVTANCSESVSMFQELLQIQPTQTSFKVCLIVSDLCLIVKSLTIVPQKQSSDRQLVRTSG